MLPHRRGYGKSHLGHHFRDSEREVSDTHGRFLYPSPEIISSWSSIEVVITRRTRNPLAFRGPWVRIPPAPPSKKLFAFFGKELFCLDGSPLRGSFFGSKVWNSTSKYHRVIWQCNNKFKGDHKCERPHLDEEPIKARFKAQVSLPATF